MLLFPIVVASVVNNARRSLLTKRCLLGFFVYFLMFTSAFLILPANGVDANKRAAPVLLENAGAGGFQQDEVQPDTRRKVANNKNENTAFTNPASREKSSMVIDTSSNTITSTSRDVLGASDSVKNSNQQQEEAESELSESFLLAAMFQWPTGPFATFVLSSTFVFTATIAVYLAFFRSSTGTGTGNNNQQPEHQEAVDGEADENSSLGDQPQLVQTIETPVIASISLANNQQQSCYKSLLSNNNTSDSDVGCFSMMTPPQNGRPNRIRLNNNNYDDSALPGDVDLISDPLASSTPLSQTPVRNNRKSPSPGSAPTSLHHLAKTGTTEDFMLLTLDDRSVVNSYDKQKRAPLHIAIEWNNLAAVNFLLKNGASTRLPNSDGLEALHLASKFNRPEIAEILLRNKAPVNRSVFTTKWTALHFAALSNAHLVVDLLLKAGANVNDCDIWLETPLHKAATEGAIESARRLVTAGGDLTIRNAKEETPAIIAICHGYDQLAALLIPPKSL